jgi:hypothetical protein
MSVFFGFLMLVAAVTLFPLLALLLVVAMLILWTVDR